MKVWYRVRLCRPCGLADKLFGMSKLLYLRIETWVDSGGGGRKNISFFMSRDGGSSWSAVSAMRSKPEIIDTIEIR